MVIANALVFAGDGEGDKSDNGDSGEGHINRRETPFVVIDKLSSLSGYHDGRS